MEMDTKEIALWLWKYLSFGDGTAQTPVSMMPEQEVLDRLEKLVKHTDFDETDIKEIVRKK